MNTTPRFDLVDIVQTLRRRRMFIIIVTLITTLLALGVFFIRHKHYKGMVQFFVSNPLYNDRFSIFGANAMKLDYYGDEDDIDKVMGIAHSDTVLRAVIWNAGLDKVYGYDANQQYGMSELKRIFNKNYDVKRTETKMIELTYRDWYPDISAKVANEAMKQIELAYRGFYNSRKQDVMDALQHKMDVQDSVIKVLTDTLAKMREVSGIYDIISPNRENMINGIVKGNGGKNMGRYIEEIQNIEALKDINVSDRAKYYSLRQQYGTGSGPGEMPLLHIVTRATPPIDPSDPPITVMLLAGFFIGLFFSAVYVLIATYYKQLVAVER